MKARDYAKTEKKKLIPLERGILVCDWLVKKMDSLFNVGYTAEMEAELDKVEEKGEPMNDMLSVFYGNFLKALDGAAEPPPDLAKFETVFGLLDVVQKWKPAKKIGKRVYDDKAFVDSVKDQIAEGKRAPSARQLEFLIKMVLAYADQIPDAEKTLKSEGIGAGASLVARADAELVKYCFGIMDRIPGMIKNPFLKSLRDQHDRGKGLSPKQFQILAKAIAENCGALEDAGEIREKLSAHIPEGYEPVSADPTVSEILKIVSQISEWRPVIKRGKKVYDDKAFVQSLADQFARRHSLSVRQVIALKRVAVAYKDKIPGFAENSERLGLNEIPSSNDKKAKVLNSDSAE